MKKLENTDLTIIFPPAGSGSKGDEAMIKGALRLFQSNNNIIINPEQRSWKSELSEFHEFSEVYFDSKKIHEVLKVKSNVVFVGADVIDGSAGIQGSLVRLDAIAAAAMAGNNVYVFFSYRADVESEIKKELKELTKNSLIKFFPRDEASFKRFVNDYQPKNCEFFPDLAFFSQDIDEITEKSIDVSQRFSIGINFSEQSFRATRVEITDENRKKYVQKYLDVILEKYPESDIVLFSNDIRMWHDFWSDYDYSILCQNILKEIYFKGQVKVINPTLNYNETINELHKVDLTISGRMHLAIASFIASTLPIIITGKSFESRDDLKQRGMFDKARGMLDWCFGHPECVVTSSQELREILDGISSSHDKWQELITENRHKLSNIISTYKINNGFSSTPIPEKYSNKQYASSIISTLKIDRFKLEIDCRNQIKELEVRGLWAKHLQDQLKVNEQVGISQSQALNERNGQIFTLSNALAQRDGQMADLSQALSERNEQIVTLSNALTKCDGQMADLSQALSERNEQIVTLSNALTQCDGQIAGLRQALKEQEITNQNILESKSWKVTAPLRKLNNMLNTKKIKGESGSAKNQVITEGPSAFFTICSKNFLAHARTLHNSIIPHYPNCRFFVVLCDRVDGLFDPLSEPFEFIYLEDLKLPNLSEMASRYNITEFNTSVKPFAFLRLMEEFQFDSVVYLDPDLYFVDRMHEIDQLLADGAEAVLTPHILQPGENVETHDQKMLVFGIYNLGFLALRNTLAVRSFLQWWGRRLEKDCVIRLEDGLFVDQKWADLLPAFVPGTRILHHPGYNVAYWNLPQRKITRKVDRWFANDQPLCFVHFSGNKLDDVTTFSRHSQQVTLKSIGVLRELLDTYREEVYKQGHAFYRTLPYAYSWDGAAGVNLHTPKELDLSKSDVVSDQSDFNTSNDYSPSSGTLDILRFRYAVLRRAIPVARNLAGGWLPFALRAWKIYRQHGLSQVKSIAVELSDYKSPPKKITIVEVDKDKQLGIKPLKRLLYLDWAIPKPDQDAASVTASLLMQIFDSIGYKVTFIPCGLKYEVGYYEDLVAANVEVIVYPEIQSVKEWLEANAANYDVCVMARGPVVWPYLKTIKMCAPHLRLIFNTVDLHYVRELREAELANNELASKAALVLRDQEFDLIDQCDLTILLSNDELYTVRDQRPEASLTVLPVVFKNIPGAAQGYEQRQDILFIGSFPHKPNIDAVIYFAESVFPIIKRQIPNLRFKVIGSNPPEEIQRLATIPGIDILGFVKDLEPVFAGIRLTVAPLRYGAGIKGKIGTSLCYGVPCVATPMAVEGMGLTPGLNVLVGETPETFASAVCDAYQKASLWKTLSTEGHRFAVENYSIDVIQKRVQSLLFAVSNGWSSIHNVVELDDWEAFQKHSDKMKPEYERRVLLEQDLLPTDGSDGFRTSGFCCVCGTHTRFLTSFMYSTVKTPDGRPMPNWREHMQCEHCGLVNRMRAALNLLHTYTTSEPDSRIYITERLTKTYQWLAERYPNLQGSEYFGPSHHPGSMVDGIRHEDVMNLSFADESFSRVLSFDVLEHVPDPYRAFSSLLRVLKPGGVLIFSVPFSSDSTADIVRATLEDDGTITHHMPAEYHGNPVDPEGGALCFRYFGWEMLDDLRRVGFSRVRCLAYWSEDQGYLGREQYAFVATKGHG